MRYAYQMPAKGPTACVREWEGRGGGFGLGFTIVVRMHARCRQTGQLHRGEERAEEGTRVIT